MSAWSSATGKPQLSYADRLRHASKSAAPSKHDTPSAAVASSGPSASASSSSHRPAGSDALKPHTHANDSSDNAPGQTHSKQSATYAADPSGSSGSAHPNSSTATQANTSSTGAPTRTDTGAPVNVWEARRKQLAEREAEKARERQQAVAQQRKESTSTKASIPSAASNAGPGTSRVKQTAQAAASKKGAEKQPKSTPNANVTDKKSSKPAAQPLATAPPTPTAASTSDVPAPRIVATTPAPVPMPSTITTPSASKGTSARAQQPSDTPHGRSAKEQHDLSGSSSASIPAKTADKPNTEQKNVSSDVSEEQHSQRGHSGSAAASASSEKGTRLQSATTPATHQPAPALMPVHDDVPGSPATVASAIEEVLKNGGVNGAQTEDDDAWLARIHLLNGGQNMPKFGGIGPNGALGLGEEEEAQAAKKAERAVAAAWGAGKSVWNKSQQQHQQQVQEPVVAGKQGSASTVDTTANRAEAQPELRDDAARAGAEKARVSSSAATSPPAEAAATDSAETTKRTSSSGAKVGASAPKPDSAAGGGAKKSKDEASRASGETPKPGKAGKAAAASVPPFEDVNYWPSPLDAGKKAPVERAKAPAAEGGKAAPAKTAKSFYETLDELQLRLAPGAHAQPGGASAGARKGKQQWVSILPDITHAASGSGAKQARPAAEAKPGKTGKQPRKDGQKGGAQTSAGTAGKADKEGTGKATNKQAKQRAPGDVATGASAKAPRPSAKTQNAKDPAAHQPSAARADGSQDDQGARTQETESAPAAGADARALPAAARAVDGAAVVSESGAAPTAQGDAAGKATRGARSQPRQPNGGSGGSTAPNGVRPNRSVASSAGTRTPATNRSSPRASVASSPLVRPSAARPLGVTPAVVEASYAAPPAAMYFAHGASSGAGAGMAPWLGYGAMAAPMVYESTAQSGAPVPSGVRGQLLAQVEFYFSSHNLQGDFFLRQKMDAHGWVDLATLAAFKRVQAITRDVELLKQALLASNVLDVDTNASRVRKRWTWHLYVLHPEEAVVEDDPALGIVAAEGMGGSLAPP